MDSGGVCILGRSRSRSQYFRFEQEPKSTVRSVQEPMKHFKGPIKISILMLVMSNRMELIDVFYG